MERRYVAIGRLEGGEKSAGRSEGGKGWWKPGRAWVRCSVSGAPVRLDESASLLELACVRGLDGADIAEGSPTCFLPNNSMYPRRELVELEESGSWA